MGERWCARERAPQVPRRGVEFVGPVAQGKGVKKVRRCFPRSSPWCQKSKWQARTKLRTAEKFGRVNGFIFNFLTFHTLERSRPFAGVPHFENLKTCPPDFDDVPSSLLSLVRRHCLPRDGNEIADRDVRGSSELLQPLRKLKFHPPVLRSMEQIMCPFARNRFLGWRFCIFVRENKQ